MKKYLIFILLLMSTLVRAQSIKIDLPADLKKYKDYNFVIDSLGDFIKTIGKEIGMDIPHLVIFNITDNRIPIKIAYKKDVWNSFLLKAKSKNAYRCDNIQRLFIIVNSDSPKPVKAKIYRNRKYIIYYDEKHEIFDIKEIT